MKVSNVEPVLRERDGVKDSGYRSQPVLVKAVGGLHFIKSNGKPHFSLCGEVYSRGRMVAGGQVHDLLLKLWPELKPLADLHLSDIDGVPMHAEANAYYWAAGAVGCVFGRDVDGGYLCEKYHGGSGNYGKSPDECLAILGKHLRISEDESIQLVNRIRNRHYAEGKAAGKELLRNWIELRKPMWKAEAEQCIKQLDLAVFGDEWKEAA